MSQSRPPSERSPGREAHVRTPLHRHLEVLGTKRFHHEEPGPSRKALRGPTLGLRRPTAGWVIRGTARRGAGAAVRDSGASSVASSCTASFAAVGVVACWGVGTITHAKYHTRMLIVQTESGTGRTVSGAAIRDPHENQQSTQHRRLMRASDITRVLLSISHGICPCCCCCCGRC